MKTYTHQPMKDNWDKEISILFGVGGGIITMLGTNQYDVTYWAALLKAGLTAFVCGIMGLLGKQCYVWAKAKYKNWKTKK